MMDSPINLDICDPNYSAKDLNHWNSYTSNLDIVVKAGVGPNRLYGLFDNRRIMCHRLSPHHSSSLEDTVFFFS